MTPIKDPSIYPDDWLEIRAAIMWRAEAHCECNGECGVKHPTDRCVEVHSRVAITFNGNVCLTIAHLDHDAAAGNHEPSNLKAMCQRCHLNYDRRFRQQQQRALRDAGQRDAFRGAQ